MKPFVICCVLFVSLCAASAFAFWSVADSGQWPKWWPAELEPLRKQSSSMRGGVADLNKHRIRFNDREEFEAAWPHLLKVKSKGAPIVLLRSPHKHWSFPETKAAVVVHCPPGDNEARKGDEAPLDEKNELHVRWIHTYYIELVVDGEIVDLNRIALPENTPIVDRRFDTGE